jgi:hypothetical protein
MHCVQLASPALE